MNVVADLHVHTTASDGLLEFQDILAQANAAGLEAVAITDHDRIHPELQRPIEDIDGMTVIRGLELKVERTTGARFDVLAFGVRETEPLLALIEQVQNDRMERGRRMRSCLEEELGVSLSLDIERGIGRPHLARAVASHPDLELTEQEVFDEHIGDGRPCFIARDVPSFSEVQPVLEDAAGVTALAHPLRYEDLDRALALGRELGAIERWYPYDTPVDAAAIDRAIEEDGLLPTGGSDAHEDGVGEAGVGEVAYRSFRRQLDAGS